MVDLISSKVDISGLISRKIKQIINKNALIKKKVSISFPCNRTPQYHPTLYVVKNKH